MPKIVNKDRIVYLIEELENNPVNYADTKLSWPEVGYGLSLAGIYSCRLLGLFMVLPVLALYIQPMPRVTGWQLGLAIGIYGIFQALLQLPFGLLSDRYGRKPIIAIGLIIFIIGSIVCAFSHDIKILIIGRALQGAGAIGSTINALAADLTRPQVRSKVLAIIGIGVGGSFLLGMVISSYLNAWIGVPGLFTIASLLGILGLGLLFITIPTPSTKVTALNLSWQNLQPILLNINCLRLDVSIFMLHAILAFSFTIIPLLLAQLALPNQHITSIYGYILIPAFIITLVILHYSERCHQRLKIFLLLAISLLGITQLGLGLLSLNSTTIYLLLLGFFIAFIFLEATLPALLTRIVLPTYRGTASGIFATAQYSGIFVGGLLGGILTQHTSLRGSLSISASLSIVWLAFMLPLQISAKENLA